MIASNIAGIRKAFDRLLRRRQRHRRDHGQQ
jgi:hypothetical protein